MSPTLPLCVAVLALDTPSAAIVLRPLLLDERMSVQHVLFSRTLAGRKPLNLLLHLLRRSGAGYVAWQVRRRFSARGEGPSVRELFRELRPGAALEEVGSIHEPGAFDSVRRLRPDLLVCASFPEKLTGEQFRVPSLGAFNVHGSLLPEYRGVTPVLHALADGAAEHGSTVHLLDESLDTGPVLTQERFSLEDVRDYATAWRRTAEAGAAALGRALDLVAAGPIDPRPQGPGGSYCSWPTRETLRRARARGVVLN